MIEKKSATIGGEAPAPLGGITKVDSGIPAIDLVVDAPIERIGAAPLAQMDVEAVEVALVVAPPALPTVVEEEVQVSRLSISIMLVKRIATKTIEEEVPIIMGSSTVDARSLLAIADVLMSNVAGEVEVTTMASLLVV